MALDTPIFYGYNIGNARMQVFEAVPKYVLIDIVWLKRIIIIMSYKKEILLLK